MVSIGEIVRGPKPGESHQKFSEIATTLRGVSVADERTLTHVTRALIGSTFPSLAGLRLAAYLAFTAWPRSWQLIFLEITATICLNSRFVLKELW